MICETTFTLLPQSHDHSASLKINSKQTAKYPVETTILMLLEHFHTAVTRMKPMGTPLFQGQVHLSARNKKFTFLQAKTINTIVHILLLAQEPAEHCTRSVDCGCNIGLLQTSSGFLARTSVQAVIKLEGRLL